MSTLIAFPRPAPSVSTSAPNHAHQRRCKRARDLAKRLSKLVISYPEFRAILEDPLEHLEHQASRTPESDRSLVLNAIHTGAWTIKEICNETRLARPELQTILDALVAAKIVIIGKRKEKNPTGGPPTLLYLPAPNFQP